MDAVLEALRPGALATAVYEIGDRILKEERLENYLMYVAHGVGRNVHEEPVLAPGSPWTLAPGMVLAVELVTVLPDLGMIGLEDDVVITPDGCENLTIIGRQLLWWPCSPPASFGRSPCSCFSVFSSARSKPVASRSGHVWWRTGCRCLSAARLKARSGCSAGWVARLPHSYSCGCFGCLGHG